MAKTTILTNNTYTAVFMQELFRKEGKVFSNYHISYYTVDGATIKESDVTKNDGITAFKKLIAKGYKVVARAERA